MSDSNIGFYESKDLDWIKIKKNSANLETPVLLLDPEIIKLQFKKLSSEFPEAQIFYALKANPDENVIATLANTACGFELASKEELKLLEPFDVSANRIAFGNTIKKAQDIQYFYASGVRLFASDSEEDICTLAKLAPASKVYIRLLAEPSDTADWPLDRKFGCYKDYAIKLLILAKDLGLIPYGISFHVGSQQNNPDAWESAIKNAGKIFADCAEIGIELKLLNIGGGFPVAYLKAVPDIKNFAKTIQHAIRQYFKKTPILMMEPGRYLVAEAGILVTETMLVTRKHEAESRWVYLDVGVFGGLTEAAAEATKYPIFCDKTADSDSEVILAGPTCDGRDILYEHYRYELPDTLALGDRLYLLNAGAYTVSCGSVAYNGFKPIAVSILT